MEHNLRVTKPSDKHKRQRGQSLVEMALILPILILMLIGLFEVGYALWGYMNLVNVNREVTRYSIRPNVLDFTQTETDGIGYTKLVTHTNTVLQASASNNAFQIRFENEDGLPPNSGMIVTHIIVDTKEPCDTSVNSNCYDQCADPEANFTDYYTIDDLVVHPGLPGYDYLQYSVGPSGVYTTRIQGTVLDEQVASMIVESNRLNCAIKAVNDGASTTPNAAIIVEMFYDQPQLLGFPVTTLLFPDPVPLYSRTSMRLPSGISNKCEITPIVVRGSLPQQGGQMVSNSEWAVWNPNEASDLDYIARTLEEPRYSTNDYRSPAAPGTVVPLTQGSQVEVRTYTNEPLLMGSVAEGAIVVVPVMSGNVISSFIQVRILEVTASDVTVQFIEDVTSTTCPN